MLVVSPLSIKNEIRKGNEMDDFPDFGGANLLDSIDFDDLLVGINDEDFLPDLEMDPQILSEFSLITSSDYKVGYNYSRNYEEVFDKANSASDGGSCGSGSTLTQLGEDVVVSKRYKNNKEGEKGRKSSSQSKNPQGKRKVKVDWTPELHRRFVKAVEQLGVDKAVPSRILELMGIHCLTRHNIASHLQKYRSHRKHLLAKEAAAANWTQRRQMYGGAAAAGVIKRDMKPWISPTMGFPPVVPLPHFRPLHVWGHPPVLPPPPPATWPVAAPAYPPPPPLADPSFWHSAHQRVPNGLTPGTPCFPPHLTPARFPTPPVPGIPPQPMFIPIPPPATGQAVPPQLPVDFHPSKESIDAAIGDAISKPWLPLPLGLKPPSVDSVLVELQQQGVPKIPPVSSV